MAVAVLVGGVAFGALGGEYRSIDYWRLKGEVRQIEYEIADLERAIDSLAAYADSLETDSATQERVARERFGMLRPGEILYVRADPDEGGAERRE
ncbi:MAG: septum formation initiator family protein [Gemmatimonadota bacterium]|nr:MAG: septum formation initiator family protein [Gemmatimonadota bacterium]